MQPELLQENALYFLLSKGSNRGMYQRVVVEVMFHVEKYLKTLGSEDIPSSRNTFVEVCRKIPSIIIR